MGTKGSRGNKGGRGPKGDIGNVGLPGDSGYCQCYQVINNLFILHFKMA